MIHHQSIFHNICLNKEVFPEYLSGFLKNAKLELTAFGILI